jgi:hypothetical protein
VNFHAPGGDPVRFTLPRPAKGAVVIRPAMTIDNPRNEEWGEPPRRPIEEIGAVRLNEDRTVLEFLPGTNPVDGLLFVLFDEPTSPDDVTVARADAPMPLLRSTVWSWSSGKDSLRVRPGTVFLPPPSEIDRMRARSGAASPEEIAELCALGYLEGEICGAEGGEPPHEGH